MRISIFITALALAASAHAADYVKEVKAQVAPDARQVVFEVELARSGNKNILRGVTSEQSARDAMVKRLRDAGVQFVDSLKVYPTDRMAIVSIPVASLRTRGAHAGEMATQAVMGTPVRMLEKKGEWWRVQTPDGYIAWVPESSIAEKSTDEMAAWRADDGRMIVSELWQTRAFYTPDAAGPRDVVTDLVLGAIVQRSGIPDENGRTEIILPDGRRGWAPSAALTPIKEWAAQDFDAQKILDTAYSMEGTPYLWGGMSTKAIDCSGLVKVSYFNNGIILMRDASQQALTGKRLEADQWRSYEPGDLMFIGNAKTGRITHVAIYDHDGKYIHSSGRVKRNSVDPESPDYLYSPLHSARMHGYEGTRGITQARNHPWYFQLSNNL